ncbi:MAG: HisA/HisF-related TIM barrel protein [Candidatus Diapherotrites archaeon]|nr:HisA/HisF-related TIM barrel protein [Candidatus Diapherotrites archaeon]
MIIPSIDLMDGKVVQLVQGREKALEIKEPPAKFAERFTACKEVQVIDLDAAKGSGSNAPLVKEICKKVNARVGGGIRSVDKAVEFIEAGAKKVIIGTMANKEFLSELMEKVGKERIVVALIEFLKEVRKATKNRVAAAGGISSLREIRSLEKEGIDAVVGMALYTGKIKIEGVELG